MSFRDFPLRYETARLSLFDLSVLIRKSIYAPVVEFHEGPYNFFSYRVHVFLKVLGHEPFFRWLFSRLIEFVELSIFSWMEFSSFSYRDLFLSELPLVLADFGGFSLRCFLPLSLLVFSEPVGSYVFCSLGLFLLFGSFVVSLMRSCFWAFGILSS